MGSVVSRLPAVAVHSGRKRKLVQLPAGQIYNQAQLNKHPDRERKSNTIYSAVSIQKKRNKDVCLTRRDGRTWPVFPYKSPSVFCSTLATSLSEWSIKLSPLSSLLAHLHVWDGWWIPVIIQCVGMRLDEVQKTFSLLQSSTSHDSSEIILIRWFAAQETCTIIISVENSCAAYYYTILWWNVFKKNSIYLK